MALKDLFKKKDETTSASGVTEADLAALKKPVEEVKEEVKEVVEEAKTAISNAKPAEEVKEAVEEAKVQLKKVEDVAKEVIRGDWGNGDERKQRLEAAGYKYDEIQSRVNDILAGKEAAPAKPAALKPIDEIAQEAIRGEWGNGEERKQRLEAAGYKYENIQNKVNELLK